MVLLMEHDSGRRAAVKPRTRNPEPEPKFRLRPPGFLPYSAFSLNDPIVQWPRTLPFHGSNTGSNPVRVAIHLNCFIITNLCVD
jgi:hypothetical protein